MRVIRGGLGVIWAIAAWPRALGLAHPDPQSIDQALARRLPSGEPFSQLAQRLHNAQNPAEIMRAASALHELTQKLKTNR